MNCPFLSAAAAVVILAVSPVEGAHAAARVPDGQSFQVAQTGKSVATAESKRSKSAEPNSAKTKALRRAYAIRARIVKQKQLAKSKKQSLKGKKKQKA